MIVATLLSSVAGITARAFDGSDAGTVISNRAEATYQNEAGESFSTTSEIVTVTVMAVAALAVTPDDTAPSNTLTPNDSALRMFRVCNTGNVSDTFVVTRVDVTAPATVDAAYFDVDADGKISGSDSKIALNGTASPEIQPGGCLAVLVSIKTNDVAPHSNVTMSLAVRSNAANSVNRHAEDTGTIINTVGEGPRFVNPEDPNLQPLHLINGKSEVVLAAGAVFTNSVEFKNGGDAAARKVVLTQETPDGFEIVVDSVQVEGQNGPSALSQRVEAHRVVVTLPLVQPGETVRVTYRVKITGNLAGGYVWISQPVIAAENVTAIKCAVARVILNPFGVVFAGRAGVGSPISGAQIKVGRDINGGSPVKFEGNGSRQMTRTKILSLLMARAIIHLRLMRRTNPEAIS